jgi:hypothetical protein
MPVIVIFDVVMPRPGEFAYNFHGGRVFFDHESNHLEHFVFVHHSSRIISRPRHKK